MNGSRFTGIIFCSSFETTSPHAGPLLRTDEVLGHLLEHEHEATIDTPGGSIEGKGELTISILQIVLGNNF